MSTGLHHSQQLFNACKIFLTRSHRHFSLLSRNGVIAACMKQQRSSVQQASCRRWKFSAPTLAFSVMQEPQTNEDLISVPREAQHYNVGECDGWLSVGEYNVFAWSVSGVESCIVVKSEDVLLAFDMGVAVPESVKAANVFITHGHVDHIGAVVSHIAKRALVGMRPARYLVPPSLVQSLNTVLQASFEMAQTPELLDSVRLQPFTQDEAVWLNSSYFVKAFPTHHRITSQGYIMYREEKSLKREYRGREGFEVAALHRKGVDIHDVTVTPEIAYCGDTMFDVFTNPPNPDLLKVKLLITEATFLDDGVGKNMLQKAKDRGHTHLHEFIQNAELFKDVGHIILVHFSNKYSPKYIRDCLRDNLPPGLIEKVTPAVVAKSTVASTNS